MVTPQLCQGPPRHRRSGSQIHTPRLPKPFHTKLTKRARDGRDGTVYGEYSTDSYYAHHAGAISMSVVRAEGERLEKGMQKIEAKLYRPCTNRANEAAAAGGA